MTVHPSHPGRSWLGFVVSGVTLALAACAGPSAEAPLTVPLGLDHAKTDQALRAHQFCRDATKVDSTQELFPRCERPAAEVSQAWVTAIFDHDHLVELRRWERFSDDARAVERWNDLVGARTKLGPPSQAALASLKVHGGIQAGTRSVQAFDAEPGTVVGIYLLTPTPPENASILERITYAPAKP